MPLRSLLAAGALLGSALVTVTAGPARAAADPAAVVDPFLGTTNSANDFPGADVPFGMMQWSPDTSRRPDGGGYDYKSGTITGFSLTHMAGPGCHGYGDVPIMPTVGAIVPTATSAYSHSHESASPGYYSVALDKGVRTELTTTTRAGIGRFTFPATSQANLLFKLTGSQTGDSATNWHVLGPTAVEGSVTSGNFCGSHNKYTVYFAAAFDHPFKAGTFRGGGHLTFNTTSGRVVRARIGISFTSAANAVANRDAETPAFDFTRARSAAHHAWSAALRKIMVTGGTNAQRAVFYTAMYHALLHPNVFSDVNGQYRGFDDAVHTVRAGHAQYANYSGWDIYRTQAQLAAMIAPSRASDIAQSMVADYAASGRLPKWSQASGETYVMVGDPAAPIIADIYAFGARDFDTSAALRAMIHEATVANNIRPGLSYLDSPGYLPTDGTYGCCNSHGQVSTQLEYDTADFALSAFARALGDTPNRTKFINRAQDWRNIFNPATGFMRPRLASGAWRGGFDPTSKTDFVEGTSWQYTGMVPFNVAGLIAAHGGRAKYNAYLDHVLASYKGAGGDHADLTNEPSLELPWEYDFSGRPWRTQAVVSDVRNKLWPDSPTGWAAGNDDLGTMSAWYVWAAMGIYPEIPGTSDLVLAAPEFSKIVISLPGGRPLTINAPRNGTYVQHATWNGARWDNAFLLPSAVLRGGTLTFTLGSPPTSWATSPSSAPPSYS